MQLDTGTFVRRRPELDGYFTSLGTGDYRGPYGYGRPAHAPDPNARYGFSGRSVALGNGSGPSGAARMEPFHSPR